MTKRLSLRRETLSELTPAELAGIAGGSDETRQDTCHTGTCRECPSQTCLPTCPLVTPFVTLVAEPVTKLIP